jgi:uncharacterized protein DUF5666
MTTRSLPWALAVASAVVGFGLAGARLAAAHDSGSDPNGPPMVTFEVEAPIDATSCDSTPPTVTLLGLPIDLTHATFVAPRSDDGENEGDDDGEWDDDGQQPMPPPAAMTCADLVVGNTLEALLVNDTAPLAATQVGAGHELELLGPIEMIDPNAQTLTLFGLTIDASSATAGRKCGGGGDDQGENESEGHWKHAPTPIDLTTLAVGQFVKVELDPAQLPMLVATSIDLQNAGNQMQVDLEDQDGNEVNDDADSVDVTVDQKSVVAVQKMVHGVAKTRRVSRSLHFQMKTHGSFTVNGLASGRARIHVTRSTGGSTSKGKGVASVQPNQSNTVSLRLRPAQGK